MCIHVYIYIYIYIEREREREREICRGFEAGPPERRPGRHDLHRLPERVERAVLEPPGAGRDLKLV